MTRRLTDRNAWIGGWVAGKVRPGAGGVPEPVEFARRMGFEADEHQAAVLRSTAKQGILNCTRQWGKSTTAAAKAIWQMVAKPGCLVVVASPSKKQSAELVLRAAGMVAKLGMRVRGDRVYDVSMVLPNGSRLVGLPGREATVRGLSRASLVLIDEASRVSDAMYRALRPMLALEQGSIWLMSTPWATQGFFYEAWANGGEEWERVSVRATECSRFSAEWLEKERKAWTAEEFQREFMGVFLRDEGSAFDAEVVDGAMDDGVAGLDLGIVEFRKGRLRGR